MAFTLLAALGEAVGRSLVERDRLEDVAAILDRSKAAGVEIVLPFDVVATDEPTAESAHDTVALGGIGDRMGVDIGPQTSERFAGVIAKARSVLWNGPMGIFEIDDYAAGTKAVAEAVVRATRAGAYSVVGGGDSAAALNGLRACGARSLICRRVGEPRWSSSRVAILPAIAVLRRSS